jgi:hypothetical protein
MMQHIGSSFAGNYLLVLLFLRKDAIAPHQVRKSLSFVSAQDAPRGEAGMRSESDQMPSVLELMRLRAGMTSNWSTFCPELVFPGVSEMQHHMPLLQLEVMRFPSNLIIFRSQKNKLSVLLVASPSSAHHDAVLADNGPFLAGGVEEITAG